MRANIENSTITELATITDLAKLRAVMMVLKKHRSRSEVLSSAIVRTAGNVVEFIATDLTTTKILRLPADVHAEGVAVVDIMDLDKLAVKLKKLGEPITIGHETWQKNETEHSATVISTSRMTTRLLGHEIDDFPSLDFFFDVEPGDSVDHDALIDGIASAKKAISSDTARENLTGLYMTGDLLVATDGHRLRKKRVLGASFGDGVIVPGNAVELVEYTASKFKTKKLRFALRSLPGERGKIIRFDVGDHTIATRSIEGSFPDYTKVLPDYSAADKILVDKAELLQTIDLVSVMASSKTNLVRLSTEASTLVAYASDPDSGEMSAAVAAHHGGKHVAAGFNYTYLQDALKDLDEETVSLVIKDTLSPCLITEPGDDDDCWIVMPMRL